MRVSVYLAGAMRFTEGQEAETYDRVWRRAVAAELVSSQVNIYDPMFTEYRYRGKTRIFDKFPSEPNALLHQDLARILRADIVFMNLLSLTPDGGYPHIGTLAELGISIAQHKLLIVVATNPSVTKHPFVRAGATRLLPKLDDGIEYLKGAVAMLLGETVYDSVS